MNMEKVPSQSKVAGLPAALTCTGLWKVYGTSPAAFAAAGGSSLSPDEMAARGWTVAMRDVTLSVGIGEVFVIMGLSGSGKSTLVRCLSRLVEPTTGSVRIGDTDLLAADADALVEIRRKKMGMVFQHFALLPHRTALDNIAFPLQAQGVERKVREKRAQEMATLVGLTGREARFPSELSGGQQQRVGIARSLATNPALWFLDEPFSALDPLIRADLQDELVRLQLQLHKTILFITHDLDEAIRLADRIAIMENGRVVQVATPEELVLYPADDYVRRFVSRVPIANVMRCGRLAVPGQGTGEIVRVSDTVAEVARRILESGTDASVISERGTPVGRLRLADVMRTLAGIRPDDVVS